MTIGKSSLRKASEKRELERIMGTKSVTLPPENAAAVPIGLADVLPVYAKAVESTGGGSPLAVRNGRRGGGDVIGASRRNIDDKLLMEASERSTLLLTQLPDY